MEAATHEILERRVKHLGNFPAMPAILRTITEGLSEQASKVDVDKIVKTLSLDESLVAQCLRMANSAFYRQRGDIASVRDAVLTLGLWRIRDLAFSSSMPLMFSNLKCVVPEESFWRHALATGVVAQKLGADFGNAANEQIYLAGLLHDIGILINALLVPDEFRAVMQEAVRERVPVSLVERRVMGFTHSESGRIVAELWRLPGEVAEVIEFHHHPEDQKTPNELSVIVQVADRLCWNSELGYGYPVPDYEGFSAEDIWQVLSKKFPKANHFRCEDYGPVLEANLAAAHELAEHVFGKTRAL